MEGDEGLTFQCCFCEKGIHRSQEREAVVLNASSLAKWREGRGVDGQSFYAHASCLTANCKTSYPWEIEGILSEGDERGAWLRVSVTKWADDHQPGIVECEFVDARGLRHVFQEKVPVVSADHIDANSPFPLTGSIACTIVERNDDASADIDVDLPHGVQRVRVWLSDLYD